MKKILSITLLMLVFSAQAVDQKMVKTGVSTATALGLGYWANMEKDGLMGDLVGAGALAAGKVAIDVYKGGSLNSSLKDIALWLAAYKMFNNQMVDGWLKNKITRGIMDKKDSAGFVRVMRMLLARGMIDYGYSKIK